MTDVAATGQQTLGWADLAPLYGLLAGADLRIRAAAAEAAARLPLTLAAWERLGAVLSELLETTPSAATAKAAARAPLPGLRLQLRTIAADGGHPGRHLAAVALSDIGDDSVLAAEVSRLLARQLTDHTAVRLAGLPLERLPMPSARIPDVPPSADRKLQSLCTAVAAARLGDPDRLDRLLRDAADDATLLLLDQTGTDPEAVWTASTALRADLRSIPPLPDELLTHLHRQLSPGARAHRMLRSMWLTPARQPRGPQRLDDFTHPLDRFVYRVRAASVHTAGSLLTEDVRMLTGAAPDPQRVYEAWTLVADIGAAAWPHVAWTLGRAGARALVNRLFPWLRSPNSALAACRAVRDAAAWLASPLPPNEPQVVITRETRRSADNVRGIPSFPPRPEAPANDGATAETPLKEGWAKEVPSFDVDLEAVDLGSEPHAGPATPPAPLSPSGAAPPLRPAPAPEPDGGELPTVGAPTLPRAPAYAKLACPSAVVVEEEFNLELGLAPRPTRGVTAQRLSLPDLPAYTLTVQVVVDGFSLRDGEELTFDLDVTPQTRYPTRILHLTAVADPDLDPVRSILAVFSVDGHTVGSATRAVEVVASRNQLPPGAIDTPPTGVDTALPAGAQTADLTITISRGDDLDGRRLLWSFQSPHHSVPGSAEPLSSTLGSRPEEFARSLMKTAGKVHGELLKAEITGAGRLIARLMPAAIHQAIRASAAAAGGPPSILLLSADPHVPWELARIDPPWRPEAPRMLGAQAVVGRWALLEPGPTPEPPRSVSVRDMTIVRGVYEKVIGFNKLKHAEQEALDLQAAYGATLVDAAQEPFFASLRGEPAAQVLHFAMHGKFDPTGFQDGLILVDGNVVDPLMILGADLDQHPFVFLNACQVGMAGETLGQYGGIAQSFVEAGASAVIAPLWAVNDEVARDVSLRFYSSAFSGTAPAEFLRAERERDGSGTHLAYVLYGHPRLLLTRSREANGDGDPAEP